MGFSSSLDRCEEFIKLLGNKVIENLSLPDFARSRFDSFHLDVDTDTMMVNLVGVIRDPDNKDQAFEVIVDANIFDPDFSYVIEEWSDDQNLPVEEVKALIKGSKLEANFDWER